MNSTKRLTLMTQFLLLFGALNSFGCGSGITPPATVPVSGVVTLQGQPAAGIRVTFHPQFDIGKVKFRPLGETDAQGVFVLSTGAAGNGAPPGEYIVTFKKPRIESDVQNSGIEMEVDELHGKYSDSKKSPWKVTIKKGNAALETFKLE